MTPPDYFARDTIASLEAGETVEMLPLIVRMRELGFDFSSHEEAFGHFLGEVEELREAFEAGDLEAMQDESAEVAWMLAEINRRFGLDGAQGEVEVKLKNLRRLAYIEDRLEEQGKDWKDADYETELYPLWVEAKAASC